jgi:hypothetical protein
MSITHRTYVLRSSLEPSEVLRRAGNLLPSEGVGFTSQPLSIVSTSTPFAVLGFQRRLYTRRNWLGINPFTHISALDVTCDRAGDTTNVTLRIDRTRAFLFAGFWAACGYVVALQLSWVGIVLLVVAVAAVGWFQIAVVGGRLIARELEVELATPSGAA